MEKNEQSTMTVHDLKLHEQYVRPILEGRMRYQLRDADRGFQEGDRVRFHVTALGGGTLERPSYCTFEEAETIEGRSYRVGFVLSSPGLGPGYVAFSISEV